MNIDFYKYHGTGNDFIIFDNRKMLFPKKNKILISKLCHRNLGIGADGLILLENDAKTDFKMVYFNGDGSEGMLCGNGGRSIVAFAKKLAIFNTKTTFTAVDGLHFASIKNGIISLQLANVSEIEVGENHVFTNTGSPHHIKLVENLDNYLVVAAGKKLRDSYGKEGCNINFVEQINTKTFAVRTYERGVENETLSCGTGVTAVAIAMHKTKKTTQKSIKLLTKGGELTVSFTEENNIYKNIFLTGKATFVFKGSIDI